MARPRTPTKVLEMRGAFARHPERKRARAGEPEVKQPLGDPPEGLNVLQVAVWTEIRLVATWLTIADRLQAEIAARAVVRFRDGDMRAGTLAQSALAKLGMNPVDRSRVVAEGGKADRRDPAEAYFGA